MVRHAPDPSSPETETAMLAKVFAETASAIAEDDCPCCKDKVVVETESEPKADAENNCCRKDPGHPDNSCCEAKTADGKDPEDVEDPDSQDEMESDANASDEDLETKTVDDKDPEDTSDDKDSADEMETEPTAEDKVKATEPTEPEPMAAASRCVMGCRMSTGFKKAVKKGSNKKAAVEDSNKKAWSPAINYMASRPGGYQSI
jgi:hypothetical protein